MTDDEITRDVDPAWLASITGQPPANGMANTTGDAADAVAESAFDDESTVAADDLLDRVRDAVQRARLPPAPVAAPPSAGHPAPDVGVSAAHRAASTANSIPPPPPPGMASSRSAAVVPPPPPGPRSVQTPAPTERWQPPPRLKPASTPAAAALVADPTPRRRIDPRLVIAIVVALLIGIGAGLFVATSGSDSPDPTDDTVTDTGVVDAGVPSDSGVSPDPSAVATTPDIETDGDQP